MPGSALLSTYTVCVAPLCPQRTWRRGGPHTCACRCCRPPPDDQGEARPAGWCRCGSQARTEGPGGQAGRHRQARGQGVSTAQGRQARLFPVCVWGVCVCVCGRPVVADEATNKGYVCYLVMMCRGPRCQPALPMMMPAGRGMSQPSWRGRGTPMQPTECTHPEIPASELRLHTQVVAR